MEKSTFKALIDFRGSVPLRNKEMWVWVVGAVGAQSPEGANEVIDFFGLELMVTEGRIFFGAG